MSVSAEYFGTSSPKTASEVVALVAVGSTNSLSSLGSYADPNSQIVSLTNNTVTANFIVQFVVTEKTPLQVNFRVNGHRLVARREAAEKLDQLRAQFRGPGLGVVLPPRDERM